MPVRVSLSLSLLLSLPLTISLPSLSPSLYLSFFPSLPPSLLPSDSPLFHLIKGAKGYFPNPYTQTPGRPHLAQVSLAELK